MTTARNFWFLGALTLIGFSSLAWFLMPYTGITFAEFLKKPMSPWVQLIQGSAAGLVMALVAWLYIRTEYMKEVRKRYATLVMSMNPGIVGVLFLSFCAGVGEELFFRGFMQPMIGIWPTSFLFVLIHGYLSPSNVRLTVYGIYMVIVFAFIGYGCREWGIFFAMAAHFMIDVVMFGGLLYFSGAGEKDATEES
jgi:membrane protease YdiL (CAAX protease family)